LITDRSCGSIRVSRIRRIRSTRDRHEFRERC
jgi:hypothetical protein